MEQMNIAWLNNLGSIAEVTDKLSLLQKGQNLEPTNTQVFSINIELMNIGDCVYWLQEWLDRGRIGISKNTYINLPATLSSFPK